MLERFDPINGGFSGSPKFPPSFALSMLMRQYSRHQDPMLLRAITHTLDKMSYGGMYDQLGGGFHRYSVDAQWLVPHFEKMLYDNALLATAYFEAYQLTGNLLYRKTATEILDYVLRDLQDPAGGFHSSEDADSEGKEGKFYLWTPEEIISALGDEDGKLFCDYYDVTNAGNFEDRKSILHVRVAPAEFAQRNQLTTEQLDTKLATLRAQLLEIRNKRVRPHKDDKVLTEWNGLMLSGFAKGYQVTGDVRYLIAAAACARFLETTMHSRDSLLRVYRQGNAKQVGFLPDYAFTVNGLIDLYEASFDIHWLMFARQLADEMISRFYDSEAGGFFLTLADQPDLPVRQKDSYDGAMPSGNSAAAMVLFRLSVLFDNKVYFDRATKTIASLAGSAEQVPMAYMNLLNAFDFSHFRPKEIAIVGKRSDPITQALINATQATYVPNKIVAFLDPTDPGKAQIERLIPLLKDRPLRDGKATAYVCENFVCKQPVNSPEELHNQLSQQ